MRSELNGAAVVLVGLAVAVSLGAAPVAGVMPQGQQNAMVQKYCAVCHTDVARNGGLSLEHFDAAQAPPSLVAMLLSKLTGGVALKTVRDAPTDAGAAALIDAKMKGGAMGAAGIPIPPKASIDALIHAFAVESIGETGWVVERSMDSAANARTLTASTLQEAHSPTEAGTAEVYRLIASCNAATREGYVQLAWSPVPRSGSLTASVDGSTGVSYRVEGSETMGNGNGVVLHGPATVLLAETARGVSRNGLPFPDESLTIRDLFPGETVMFSFAELPQETRQELHACFPGATSVH